LAHGPGSAKQAQGRTSWGAKVRQTIRGGANAIRGVGVGTRNAFFLFQKTSLDDVKFPKILHQFILHLNSAWEIFFLPPIIDKDASIINPSPTTGLRKSFP